MNGSGGQQIPVSNQTKKYQNMNQPIRRNNPMGTAFQSGMTNNSNNILEIENNVRQNRYASQQQIKHTQSITENLPPTQAHLMSQLQ